MSDELLAKAGGAAALEPLGGEYALRRYPNGTIIRAGTIFELGDTEQDSIPTLLPALHAILKPAYAPSFTELIQGGDDFTRRWKQRFERPH